jgi:isocitrate/isopropylmalate dehydrogenase
MTVRNLFLLPGDGIGPEAMAEVRKIIAYMNADMAGGFTTDEGLVGGCAYDAHGAAISDADMEKAMAADAVLFGAVGGPKWDDVPYEVRPEAGLLRLRKDMELFANLRPASAIRRFRGVIAEARTGRRSRYPDRARTDRRRLFRRAEGDHRSRQRPEARHRHAGL